MTTHAPGHMHRKLNVTSALVVVVLYLIVSLVATLLASIFFGGIHDASNDRVIDGVIDSGMIANFVVMVGLVFTSLWVFRENRKDIFFEREPFTLSRRYYLFPLAWFGVSLFALTQVDYAAYSLSTILLVLMAALTIGVNEEIVTRGILLIGLRNSGVREWIAWLITVVVFSLFHLLNVLGGGNITILLVTVTGGTLLYVARRVFGNLFVPIGLHALYDTAFFLLTGKYIMSEGLADHVLDIQLGSFLVLFVATILFLIFGRKLFKQESIGWPAREKPTSQATADTG